MWTAMKETKFLLSIHDAELHAFVLSKVVPQINWIIADLGGKMADEQIMLFPLFLIIQQIKHTPFNSSMTEIYIYFIEEMGMTGSLIFTPLEWFQFILLY